MGLWEQIGRFFGADNPAAPRPPVITEDVGIGLGYSAFGYGIDPDDHLYRRITQSQRELPPVVHERMLRLAWSLYESNPFAHGIIETIKDHVVGKGFEVHAADDKVQEVIDKHWEDPVNHWDLKQHDRVRDLSIYGELMMVAFVNEADGHVRLSSMDPIHIRNVYTEQDNPEAYHTIIVNPRRRIQHSPSDSDRFYRVVHLDERPESPTYGKLVGVEVDAEGNEEVFIPPGGKKQYKYTGQCFYFNINKVTGAIRGRSDLLSVIDWLDAYDQILFNFVDRTLLMNCFVWDVTLKGATRSQIDEWRANHSNAPRPGTVNIHNENEVWDEVSPKFARAEFEVQQKTLKAQILSAIGLPPHWFGEHDSNRATAQEMSGPALVRLKSRQLLIKYMIELILKFCVDQAIAKGTLKDSDLKAGTAKLKEAGPDTTISTTNKNYGFEVAIPQMSEKSLAVAGATMMNVTQSIVIAMRAGLVDLDEGQKMFVTLSTEMGADINLEAMIKRMEDSGDLQKAKDQALSPGTDEMLQPQAPARIDNKGNSTDTNNNKGSHTPQASVQTKGRPHRESVALAQPTDAEIEEARETLIAAGLMIS